MSQKIQYPDVTNNVGDKFTAENINELKSVINYNAEFVDELSEATGEALQEKANNSDLNAPVDIAFADLDTPTKYVNELFANKSGSLIYSNPTTLQKPIVLTFNSSGETTLPFTAVEGFTGLLQGITGGYSDLNSSLSRNFEKTTTYLSKGESFNSGVYSPIFTDTTSIFSAWDTPMGEPQDFDRFSFKLRTRATTITRCRITIREVTQNGPILFQTDLTGLSIAPTTIHEFVIDMGFVIANTALTKLRFQFECDGLIDRHGYSESASIYPSPTYNKPGYKTNGIFEGGFTEVTSSPPLNRVSYVQFFKSKGVFKANETLAEDIKPFFDGLEELPETQEKIDRTSEYSSNFEGTEVYPEASASVTDSTSTFSGWASAIGVQHNFTHILNKVKARATAITSIYWELRQTDKAGTLLASGTVVVNILPGVMSEVIYPMGSNIVNAGNAQLWFGFKCNQFCDNWGNIGSSFFPYPTYGQAAYVTNGDQSPDLWVNTSGSSTRNLWAKDGNYISKASPTTEFLDEIERKIVVPPPTNMLAATAEIILNTRVYALEGKQTNIYFENIINSSMPLALLDIDVTCTKGAQYDKYFRVTPTSADGGSHALTITVSFGGVLLATYTGVLNIAIASAGTGVTRKVNFFGDSTLASGQPQAVIISEQATDPMTISFQGTQGVAPNVHEGRGGWSIPDYATVGRTFYKFPVTGVTVPPSLAATYTNNSSTFTVREINITGGNGYISCERTAGTNLPTTNGVLTKTAGTGDATLNYTGSTTVTGNPLWNAGTSLVDYANYLTVNSMTMAANDLFAMHLGINDVFGYADDASLNSAITTKIAQLKTILTSVHAAVANIRVAVMVTIMPSISQDAFAANYTTGQYRKRYLKNIRAFQKALLTEFDKDSERTAGNYLIAYNAILDTENNFPTANVFPNSRKQHFQFHCTGSPVASAGAIYSNNGSTYSIYSISGNKVVANRITGATNPSISAGLTKVSGTGDASIALFDFISQTVTTWTNGVHPEQTGYDQMGDQLKAFIKYLA